MSTSHSIYFTDKKIRSRMEELRGFIFRKQAPIERLHYIAGDPKGAHRPEYDDSGWAEFVPGHEWGGKDVTIWIRGTATLPPVPAEQSSERHEDTVPGGKRRGNQVALHVLLFSPKRADLSGPEALLYINGKPVCGIDRYHTEAVLTPQVTGGDTRFTIAIKATSGMGEAKHRFETAQVVEIDRDTESLYFSLKAGIEAVAVAGQESSEGVALLNALDAAVRCIDWREPGSTAFYDSVSQARNCLDSALTALPPKSALGPTVTCVGHSHIDVAWLWPLAHTREKCSRTFSTALQLMDLYPEYRFIQSQPQLYKFIKEDYPEIYERIKEKVASGQWEPTGGMWVEADCNLISGESLVRQLLFGTRFFREEFGRECKVLWLPDVFGYSWALPQVIKKSGLEYFMTTKISWNQYNRPQYDSFRWRGLDGTEVLTHFITTPLPNHWFFTYNGDITPSMVKGIWDTYRQKDLNSELLLAFGHGDGGGGPTREMLEMARRLKSLPGVPRTELGQAEPFFDRLASTLEVHPRLPLWDGELYLEYHRGTYTSQAANKRSNRLSEVLYHDAEALSSLAGAQTAGFSYPREELRSGWELILLNQFHDIIPGSSIREVYEDSKAQYEEISRTGEAALDRAFRSLIAGLGGGEAQGRRVTLVFNPLGWDRSDLIEIPWDPAFRGKHFIDHEGTVVPHQVVEGEGRKVLLWLPDIPSLGYTSVFLSNEVHDPEPGEHLGSAPASGVRLDLAETDLPAPPDGIRMSPSQLENAFFSISLNDCGQIISLWDKRHGREVLPPGARANVLQVFEDKPLGNDAWDVDIFYGDKVWEVTDLVDSCVLEQGPLRGVLRLVFRFQNSTITERLIFYRSIARIDFETEIDWKERQLLLKVAFPVDVRSTKATYDVQFGNVERPTHWNTSWDYARFETCGHKWADLSEGGYGVSLLNDCKYGHDIKDNLMRLTLIKSAVSPDPLADKCFHSFTYSLYPHEGGWYDAGTVREAYQLNYPTRPRSITGVLSPEQCTAPPGVPGPDSQSGPDNTLPAPKSVATPAEAAPASRERLPDSFSFAGVDAPNVIIETVKKAEDGDATLVRLYEYGGRRGSVTLRFGPPVRSAWECNLMERDAVPVEIRENSIESFVKPYEIRSFLVEFRR